MFSRYWSFCLEFLVMYRVDHKMSLFFFGNNFHKNKETFKIFFPQVLEDSQAGWDLGKMIPKCYRFAAKWVCQKWSYAWGIQVFCSRNEVAPIHRQERTPSEEKSDGFHKKCSIELWTILIFELLLCCHTTVRCMERTKY